MRFLDRPVVLPEQQTLAVEEPDTFMFNGHIKVLSAEFVPENEMWLCGPIYLERGIPDVRCKLDR